jgi:hypothetical protein
MSYEAVPFLSICCRLSIKCLSVYSLFSKKKITKFISIFKQKRSCGDQFCCYNFAMLTEDQITQGTKAALDHLAFTSYEFNRALNPNISPQRWGLVYGAELVEKMEIAFQAKKALTVEVEFINISPS